MKRSQGNPNKAETHPSGTKQATRTDEPIDRNYVNELDLFLQEFDKKDEAYSKFRIAEMEKYKRIFLLRDNPSAELEKDPTNF